MRTLRIGTIVLLVVCLVVNIWVTARYNASHNTQGPTIACDSDYLELSIHDPQEALMRGMSASDAQDGDLTGSILLASRSYFLDKGEFTAEYVVFDSHQNSETVTRRIRYTDYVSPTFSIDRPLVFTKGQNIRYLDYVKATDVLDGDISDQITVTASSVSNYTAGAYPVLLQVSNSYGDTAQVELMVVVTNSNVSGASISLSDYLLYLPKGSDFDPYKLITSVTADGDIRLNTSDVQVLGSVDTNNAGSYQLIYRLEKDGIETQTYLTVVVSEEVA